MNKNLFFVCSLLLSFGATALSGAVLRTNLYSEFGWKPISMSMATNFTVSFVASTTSCDIYIGLRTLAGGVISVAVGGWNNTASAIYPVNGGQRDIRPSPENTAVIPVIGRPVEYTASITPVQGTANGLFTLTGKLEDGSSVRIISYADPMFNQPFGGYSIATYSGSVVTVLRDSVAAYSPPATVSTTAVIVTSNHYDTAVVGSTSPAKFFGWKSISPASGALTLSFSAKTKSDICVALKYAANSYIELVMGGWGNTSSVYRIFENGVQTREVGLADGILPDTTNPVAYTLVVTQDSASAISGPTLTVSATKKGETSSKIILRRSSPDFGRLFSAYSFKTYNTSTYVNGLELSDDVLSLDVAASASTTLSLTSTLSAGSSMVTAAAGTSGTGAATGTPVQVSSLVMQAVADVNKCMSFVLTSSVVLEELLTVVQPLLVRSGKSLVDWTMSTTTFIAFAKKASTDVTTWKVPVVDVVGSDQVTTRISLHEYVIRLLGYIADPFSQAPAAVKSIASTALSGFASVVAQAPASEAAKPVGGIATNAIVVLRAVAQAGAPAKTVIVMGDGSIQTFAEASKYVPSAHIKIASYDAATKAIVLAAGGKFFDKVSGKFSGTSLSAVQPLTLESIADSTSWFINVGSPSLRLKLTDSIVAPVAFVANGATMLDFIPLSSVERALDDIAAPASAGDIDSALERYGAAIEAARADAVDLAWIIASLGSYCQQAATLPDWSYVVMQKTVQGVSPKNYVASLLSTIATLTARYSGVNAAIQASIKTILSNPVFGQSISFTKGKVGVLRLSNDGCLALSTTGTLERQTLVSLCDPATHFTVSDFNLDTGELQLAIGKKNVVVQSGKVSCSESASAAKFKCVADASAGGGANLLDASNKKLRWQSGSTGGVVCGDVGDIASFVMIADAQSVLDGLSGSLVNDLPLFDKALRAVKDSSTDLAFTVSVMGSYVLEAAARPEWTTTTSVDSRNPSMTAKDFAVALLKRVSDGGWLFTGLNSDIKAKIELVSRQAQDQTAFFVTQMQQMDELALKITATGDLTATTTLVALLKVLVPQLAASGTVDMRESLLNKLDSYYDPKNVPALETASSAQKNAWSQLIFGLSAQVLGFQASSTDLLDEKLTYFKMVLLPRLVQFGTTLQAGCLQSLLSNQLRQTGTEGGALGITGARRQKLRQLLNDLDAAIQQLASDKSSAQLTKAASDGLKGLMLQIWSASGLNGAQLAGTSSGTSAGAPSAGPVLLQPGVMADEVLQYGGAPEIEEALVPALNPQSLQIAPVVSQAPPGGYEI